MTLEEGIDHPDAELIHLGREFEELASKEKINLSLAATDKESNDVVAAIGAVGREIENITANTLVGLKVKARVVAWCFGDVDIHGIDAEWQTSEYRMSLKIARDVLLMR